ncbi:DNA-3-methyladenine glycosylase II [Methylomarinovum caldicuralii]|uniref:DNA-3-methyladenine glycosylase II n=1 Tax=Methylomarinovum caldicuralii TaxID=438856 RepID=A0AAU9CRB8_9GAMM|nr:DNA-3-methyladenine glycosylase 2 family protein [Methylomarinovum caldicuralii]BCX82508.1 DNA-3-methyladenine glycosylase II [Methylomarinovum caldicuralii]
MSEPVYWDEAVAWLGRRDPVLADLIARYPERLQRRGDSFRTLVRAIVGQQISIRAADRVWARLETVLPEVTPRALAAAEESHLRGAGLSRPKIRYLRHLARYYLDRGINDAHWQGRSLADIRRELLQLTGIGPWTLEMFAIFHLHEPDVFSPGDIGLQKAVGRLYFDRPILPRPELEDFARRWAPFRTVAAWYLWRHLDPEPVIY